MQFLSETMNDNGNEDDEILEVYALPRTPPMVLLKPVPLLDISLSVGHSVGHSVCDSITLSVEDSVEQSVRISEENSLGVSPENGDNGTAEFSTGPITPSVAQSVEESVLLSEVHSLGQTAELSVGKSPELIVPSVAHSVEESVRISEVHSVEQTAELSLLSPHHPNSESISDEIAIRARTNLRQVLEARLAHEKSLQASREDMAFITSMSSSVSASVFNDSWKDDESTFTTPTKKNPSSSNRPISPVANRVLRFPPVANSTLRSPIFLERVLRTQPVPDRELRPPTVAGMVLTFPILNENDLQLQIKADRKRRQREQKERWMAANEAKKVLSYLSRIASLSFTNAPIALYPRPLLTLSRPG
jgi:hypothetical protein